MEAIRNTPLLVQIFIVYFGLASIGIKLGAFTAAIAALVINVGAYTAEIVRAGIESVPRSQLEAAQCLALSRWQVLRHVVLPPAIERVWPALTSQYVLLMLASSITSQISTEELTAIANRVQSDTFRSIETYLIVAAAYLVLSLRDAGAVLGGGQLCVPASPPPGDTAVISLTPEQLLFLLRGFGWTIVLSLLAFVGGGVLGFVLALTRVYATRPLRCAGDALHQADPGHAAADPAVPDVFRAAGAGPGRRAAGRRRARPVDLRVGLPRRDLARRLEAVPRTQEEAAACLALNWHQRLIHVILPQAVKIATPPTVGFMVQIVKNTSLASAIGFVELARAGQMINNATFRPFIVFVLIAALYFALCYPLSAWSRRLERRLRCRPSLRSRRSASASARSSVLEGVSFQVAHRVGGGHHRPQRLGQEHGAALHQPARDDRRRPASGSAGRK